MIQKFLFIILLSFGLGSCSSDDEIIQPENKNDLLIGTWVELENISGTQSRWKRANDFNTDEFGLRFSSNGDHINRNHGWCGTAPLTYFNDEGTFLRQDMILNISFPSSPSDINYSYQIISVDATYLILDYL